MVPEDDFDDLTLLADLDESRGIEKEIEQADAALQDERGGSGHAFRRRPSAESAASSSAEYSSGLADRQLLSIGSKPFAVMSVNEHNKAVLRLSAKRGQFTGRLQAAPRRNFFPKHKGLRAMWWALVVVLPWLAAMALFVSFQVLTVVVAVGLLLVTLPVAWNRVQGRSAGAQLLFCSYVSGLLVVVVLFAVFLAKPTFNMYDDLDFAMLGDVTASSIKMSVRGGSGGALAFVVDFGLAESPRLTWNATTPQPLETGAGDAIGVTTVSGLEAGELYEYQIIFVDGNGDLANGPSGSFRTLPALGATGAAGAVSFASVSCQKKNSQVGGVELDGYSRIAALEPDALLFLGDFIYADVPWGFGGTPIGYGSKEALYESDYRNTIQDEHVKSFYANFPAYFMLDDHEILNNYSEGNDTDTFVAALNVWNRYLGQLNPKTPAVSAGGGEQYTFALGERADFFVFDTRFHRDLDAGIIAGTAQVAAVLGWLADTQAARQSFKFLVSSGGWSRNEPDTNDGWYVPVLSFFCFAHSLPFAFRFPFCVFCKDTGTGAGYMYVCMPLHFLTTRQSNHRQELRVPAVRAVDQRQRGVVPPRAAGNSGLHRGQQHHQRGAHLWRRAQAGRLRGRAERRRGERIAPLRLGAERLGQHRRPGALRRGWLQHRICAVPSRREWSRRGDLRRRHVYESGGPLRHRVPAQRALLWRPPLPHGPRGQQPHAGGEVRRALGQAAGRAGRRAGAARRAHRPPPQVQRVCQRRRV